MSNPLWPLGPYRSAGVGDSISQMDPVVWGEKVSPISDLGESKLADFVLFCLLGSFGHR